MKPLMFKKIPLEQFISILIDSYDKGANYIDLTGTSEGNIDSIKIYIPEEYMTKPSDSLSIEDCNSLII